MTHEQQQQIAQALQRYCSRYSSIALAARTLSGIGTAGITHILNNDWNRIGPRKWQELAKQVGFYTPTQGAPASKHTFLRLLLGDARRHALTYIITLPAEETVTSHEPDTDFTHTIHCCATHDGHALLTLIAGSLRLPLQGSIQQLMRNITQALQLEEEPLLVLQHTDSMSSSALHVWVALYARIAPLCGIVMLAGENWQQQILQGVQQQKKGFANLQHGIGHRRYNLTLSGDPCCYAATGVTAPITRARRAHMRRHTAALLRHYNDAA